MISRKLMCFLLFVTAVNLLPAAPSPFHRDNRDKIRADGGARPAPLIPWPPASATIDGPQLNADGGQPPAPPIPWGLVNVGIQSVAA